jgi:hypothetical protein
VWNYQEFSLWMNETLHDAGGDAPEGEFRRRLARARLDPVEHLAVGRPRVRRPDGGAVLTDRA